MKYKTLIFLFIFMAGCSLQPYSLPTPAPVVPATLDYGEAKAHWAAFREAVPGHFQDWIVAGQGPVFTLIYAEPPPAFALDEYDELLANSFRGYKNYRVETRALGYNGEVSDLVIQLDYSSAKRDFKADLERDLQVLSMGIYGTTLGARPIWLQEVVANPPNKEAPEEVSVSAYDIQQWLINTKAGVLGFVSPETGDIGSLVELFSKGTGRYLAEDNTLVLLVIDQKNEIGLDTIREIRRFAIDSDLFLGGVIDRKNNSVALLGRKRQQSLIDFPALRVEDIVNAIITKDQEWAQSYDRTTPGAGRIILADKTEGDWAPSYLSAELIDTEFGSLLNVSDAILKSQSLSGEVKYKGFEFSDFSDPPYQEGVFKKFANELDMNSLIFNFNTVGAGHWLDASSNYAVFAMNSSGSFAVTYSPNSSGENSTSDESEFIRNTENIYTNWFRAQNSPELVRTVQYMGIYQLFGLESLKGKNLYPDRLAVFKTIGNKLKKSVSDQLTKCLDEIDATEDEMLQGLDFTRHYVALLYSYPEELLPMKSTIKEVKRSIVNAATAIRYEGNIWGGKYDRLRSLRETAVNQYTAYHDHWKDEGLQHNEKEEAFTSRYRQYEIGVKEVNQSDGTVDELIEYKVPDYMSPEFKRNKAELIALRKKLKPVYTYLEKLESNIVKAGEDLEVFFKEYGAKDILLKSVELVCSQGGENDFSQGILSKFENTTKVASIRDYRHAIATPTIVLSRGQGTAVGGHNIEIQNFKVSIDKSLKAGSYKFDKGVLRVSSKDAPKLSEISSGFAKVMEADPAAQQKLYEAVVGTVPKVAQTRGQSLKLAKVNTINNKLAARPIESSSVTSVNQAPGRSPFDVTFGRNAESRRIYVELDSGASQHSRIDIFGSSLTPEIIASNTSLTTGKRTARVLLDESLTKADVNAIVMNYKHAPYEVVSAGGSGASGGGKPPWNISLAKAGGDKGGEKPKMVIFERQGSNDRRVVLGTKEGNVEIYAPKNVEVDRLLKHLETEIENGASLVLEKTKVTNTESKIKLLATEFRIEQGNPLTGNLVIESNTTARIPSKIRQRVRNIFSSVFEKLNKGESSDKTFGDYFLRVKRDLENMDASWAVESRIVMKDGRLRFVIYLPQTNSEEV